MSSPQTVHGPGQTLDRFGLTFSLYRYFPFPWHDMFNPICPR